MRKFARDLIKGKKISASGYHRYVYFLDKERIIKVAKTQRGIESNKNEVKLYHNCPSELKKYLGKIYLNGRSWLIMKRYDKKVPDTLRYQRKLKGLIKKFMRNDIVPRDLSDKNIRVYHGSIVVIDYGNFSIKK